MAKKHYIADMHTHLNEKKIDPKEWWAQVKKQKLCAIAITEHTEYNPETAYSKLLAEKPKDIILIPGLEAKTTAGHLLVYGKDDSVYQIEELKKINVPIRDALIAVRKNNLVASFAHPYGYKTDSACLILNEKESSKLLREFKIGSEYYNGMLGSANNFVFGTQWIKKLYNFFDFLDKSNKAKKLHLQKKSRKIKSKLEKISEETLDRVKKGILFAEKANYVTSGSDAHYPRVIGTAVVELKRKPKNESDFLLMIKKKQINWAGPNIYSKNPVDKIRKKELLEGLKYITKKRLQKKIRKRKLNKKIRKKLKKIGSTKIAKRLRIRRKNRT